MPDLYIHAAWTLCCCHSFRRTQTFLEGTDRVGGQLREDKGYHFSGITSSGTVWRKVPEVMHSVCLKLLQRNVFIKELIWASSLLFSMAWSDIPSERSCTVISWGPEFVHFCVLLVLLYINRIIFNVVLTHPWYNNAGWLGVKKNKLSVLILIHSKRLSHPCH